MTPALDRTTIEPLVAGAPKAVLATIGADGAPHLVPVTFVLDGDRVFTAVDHKPKTTRRLQRLANIAADPRVALLVDHYEDDWTRLWWCRLEGHARIADDGPDLARAVSLLGARYPQYREHPVAGPAVVIAVTAWSGWRA